MTKITFKQKFNKFLYQVGIKRLKLITKEEFNKLSINKQRVAIAKDILYRIENKVMEPGCGMIIDYSFKAKLFDMSHSETQKEFNLPMNNCAVCAKGAVLSSWIGNFDSFSGNDLKRVTGWGVARGFPPELIDIFNERLLSAIETAFEFSYYEWNQSNIAIEECLSLRKAFGYTGSDDDKEKNVDKRLIKIFENIIQNNGKLIVPKYDNPNEVLIFD